MKIFEKCKHNFKSKEEVEVDRVFIEKKAFDVYYHCKTIYKITITADTKKQARKFFNEGDIDYGNSKELDSTGYVIDEMEPTTVLEEKE